MKTDSNHMAIGLPAPYSDLSFFNREPGWWMDLHEHTYYQLILIMEGVLLLTVDDTVHPLKAGQLCIIPPLKPHALETPGGYSQLGINLETERDQRGLVALLEANFIEFTLLERPQWVDTVPLLEAECRQLTRLSKIKLAHRIDEIVLSCVEPPSTPGELDFKTRLLHALEQPAPKLTLDWVSRQLVMSPSHLERLCKREFGCSVIELYNQIRINKACFSLISSRQSMEEIALALGFYDSAHFSRFFKQRMNVSPLQYRQSRKS